MTAPTGTRSGKAGRACAQSVWATPGALDAIAHLRAEMGRVVLRHPGGLEGEVEARMVTLPTTAGRTDFCVGVAGGVPFYVGGDEDAALGYPDFELYVRTDQHPGRHSGACQRLMSRAVGRGGSTS